MCPTRIPGGRSPLPFGSLALPQTADIAALSRISRISLQIEGHEKSGHFLWNILVQN
jgi:hypothetical protein